MSLHRSPFHALWLAFGLGFGMLPSIGHAQDDPFDGPAPAPVPAQVAPTGPAAPSSARPPSSANANAELATVRVRAFSPIVVGTRGAGRRLEAEVRVGHAVIVEAGMLVTSAHVVEGAAFVLVDLPNGTEPRVGYVVRAGATEPLAMIALPSARGERASGLERRAGGTGRTTLQVFTVAAPGSPATPTRVTLGAAHTSGRARVVGAPTSAVGAPIVASDGSARGLVHVEQGGEPTLAPWAAVVTLLDTLRVRAAAIRGPSAEAEALLRVAALTLERAQATTDEAVLAAVLEGMGEPERSDGVARVGLEALPSDASVLVAAVYTNLAELMDARANAPTPRGEALRVLARDRVMTALAIDDGLRARSPFAAELADTPAPPSATPSASTPIAATAPAPEPAGRVEAPATPASSPQDDAPRRLTFDGRFAPRLFAISLGMAFAPDADVHIGAFALDVSALWLVPKGTHERDRRVGLAVGPTIGIGTSGGDPLARIALEAGLFARVGRKPGFVFGLAWVPGVFIAESENALTATAFRARVGVALGRTSVAFGYDLASPNGLHAYHAFSLALLRER